MQRVLILCTGNSARSQMAEGLLRHDAGGRFAVFSAGIKPSRVRPEAIAAMRELGIDISGNRSKSVDEFTGQRFDYVLTVCDNAKESCPIFPGQAVTIHHNFEDPAAFEGSEAERLATFRRVRDEMREYLREFPERSIACNMKAISSTERVRYSLLRQKIKGAVKQQREVADGYAWELDGKDITLPEGAEWVAMERRCCPFLTLQLEATGNGTDYWLNLTGPAGVKAFLVSEFGIGR